MYLVAQRVVGANGAQGVNVFKYVHDLSWAGPPPPGLPQNRPGRCVHTDYVVRPATNTVLSYLDITCSDDVPADTLRSNLLGLKRAISQRGDPTETMVGPLLVQYYHGGLRVPWGVELGALAGHLVLRVPFDAG